MSIFKRMMLAAFLCSVGVGLGGCLAFERWDMRYDIAKDLTVKTTDDIRGISSDEETLEEQKEEMKEFYENAYLEIASSFAHDSCVENIKVTLSNKTDTRCDAKVVGDCENIMKLVAHVMAKYSEFEIKKTGNYFSVTICAGEEQTQVVEIGTLSVTYAGKIIENNAHKYNRNSHLMKWNLGKIDKSGIHFVLEIEEE